MSRIDNGGMAEGSERETLLPCEVFSDRTLVKYNASLSRLQPSGTSTIGLRGSIGVAFTGL